jgi:hypothetical protein
MIEIIIKCHSEPALPAGRLVLKSQFLDEDAETSSA